MGAGSDYQRSKQKLRQRIGRNRRAIDGRIFGLQRRGLRLISWDACLRWVWQELREVWAESTPDPRPEEPGDDHGRS